MKNILRFFFVKSISLWIEMGELFTVTKWNIMKYSFFMSYSFIIISFNKTMCTDVVL